ncbi:L-histidine N(alpha)-methyltransferase [Scytonema hofmannii FACHB-248]|uniref:L-histidine N(Alpha)-methyltransferase n=1 Tax=Scytonema hofmannii FACHB-248 TaxID=1842502 RepID=A0ABR8GVR7_9CYAN|nr:MULTISPECIES: L-histidine N(alpha)-methyltransferase [Nostocales]MBD2607282.1 L-histidine N(alpha)-methyltransferase [Scytonema hofmannii FACHB-248]
MAKNVHSNSQFPSHIPTFTSRTAKPSSEFYSIFSEEEIEGIIHALEVRREIPLKYSYKGRGAKIWNDFYRKYIIPKWYRTSSLEIDLLKKNFEYINGNYQKCEKVNIIDVGSGNSYPVKEFVGRLSKLGKINKYIALDISEQLLKLSQQNFQNWFPLIEFISHPIDIENSCLPKIWLTNQAHPKTDDTPKIILHLGVTMGNHQNITKVLKNFRDSMGKNDLLVFTNETGSNSNWDGKVRGGCKYHAEEVYKWIKNKMGIKSEDCQLIRKYDLETDSLVANIKFRHNYTINLSYGEIDKNIEILEGEEITIWRHHKYEIPELMQQVEKAGLQVVHYSIDKYLSHMMVICETSGFQT